MLLFYIRHGDPTYDPDELTPLGKRQAESVAKRLALYGIDRVYASTSNRAIETANPTCEILKKEPVLLDFINESHAFNDFSIEIEPGKRTWATNSRSIVRLLASKEVHDLGDKWYTHPDILKIRDFKPGVDRMKNAADEFLKSLGYEHIECTGTYKIMSSNNERVALFAHHGAGMFFLSTVLGIPLSVMFSHFTMTHTGMTVIDFKEDKDGIAMAQLLTLSNDSHLYRDGLPTKYNGQIYF